MIGLWIYIRGNMRLDKYLADMNIGSRKEVKNYIKKGLVRVNDKQIKSDKFQVDPEKDKVIFDGQEIKYQEFFYYLLHKPAGVVSATQDNHDKTVMDLFSISDYRDDLFPVGRLDKDTEGLLIITNDGAMSHRLLAPKSHVPKEYYAKVAGVMTEEDVKAFAEGITIDGGEVCMPAELKVVARDLDKNTSEIRLVLHEGKFHQVKRMVKAVGKEVTYLKRIKMGNLELDPNLAKGKYKELNEPELEQLNQK